MSWIDLTTEAGENVMINPRIYVLAKPDGNGTYFICKDPRQSIKVRESLKEIDFVAPWIKVRSESGALFQVNTDFYIAVKQDGLGSYLTCTIADQSLKIHESVTQFRAKFRNTRVIADIAA